MTFRSRLMMTMIAAGWCGCTGASTPSTQVITGSVTASDAIAVRAVVGDSVVTATQVRSDGSFTLELPAGSTYRLEVLSAAGAQHVQSASGADLTFRVCDPTDPWNMGNVGPNGGGGTSSGGGNGSDPTTGNGGGGNGGGNGSDPTTGNGGGSCGNGGTPPNGGSGVDPGGPNHPGGGGSGTTPPNGGSGVNPGGPNDPTGSNGSPPRGTDPNGNPCSPPPPPCADPSDPTTCQDPCVNDAASCGCGSNDPSCWPPPVTCNGPNDPTDPNGSGSDPTTSCDPTDPVTPTNPPPGNFGCDPTNGPASS